MIGSDERLGNGEGVDEELEAGGWVGVEKEKGGGKEWVSPPCSGHLPRAKVTFKTRTGVNTGW